ncbi:hypothetical protein N9917_00935 [Deltaproteobacteria bacterium]|nr:hypothetical protein [Deltaproteobacteria bacterium]
MGRLSRLLALLPERFQWTTHNVVAHPLSEVVWQVGTSRGPQSRLLKLSERIHDGTVPYMVGPPRQPDAPLENAA